MLITLLVAVAAAPVLVAYVVACFRDPLRFAVPPYAVFIPFSSALAIAPGPFGSVSSLLGLLAGVALMAQLVTTGRSSLRIPATVPVWLMFLALAGLSVFWSVAPQATARSFGVLASLVLLFVALALTQFDRVTLTRFETAILLGGVLAVFYGLAQWLFLGGLPTPDGRAARFGNDLLGANNQAAALLLPVAIAVARTVTGSGRRRLVHGTAVILLLVGVLLTGSRGGLLATIAVFCTVVVLTRQGRGILLSVGAVVGVLLAVVLLVNPGGLGERQARETDSSGRADIWAVGVNACRDYCLVGTGWGGFPTVYAETRASVPEAKVLKRGTAFEPHNIWMLAVVEAGVLGLFLVALALGSSLVTALRLPESMRAPPAAAVVGTLLSSLFLSNLEFKFFWAVLAYVAISATVARHGSGARPVATSPTAPGAGIRVRTA